MRTKSTPTVEIRVHPHIELLTIAFWLAGRYPAPTDSAYKTEVFRAFSKHRKHPLMKEIRSLKAVYTDTTELGYCIADPATGTLSLLESNPWVTYLGLPTCTHLLQSCLTFARDTGYGSFRQRQTRRYEDWSRRFAAFLQQSRSLETLDGFFRYGAERTRPRFVINLDPLNGWGAHAIQPEKLTRGEWANQVHFQLGYWPESSFPDTEPRFEGIGSIESTAWHEGAHIYISPLLTRYAAEIEKSQFLFNPKDLARQNIGTWAYCVNETVVRAIVAVLLKQTQGEEAYQKEVRTQVEGGKFLYVGEVARWIGESYKSAADFDALFPEILERLTRLTRPATAS